MGKLRIIVDFLCGIFLFLAGIIIFLAGISLYNTDVMHAKEIIYELAYTPLTMALSVIMMVCAISLFYNYITKLK